MGPRPKAGFRAETRFCTPPFSSIATPKLMAFKPQVMRLNTYTFHSGSLADRGFDRPPYRTGTAEPLITIG